MMISWFLEDCGVREHNLKISYMIAKSLLQYVSNTTKCNSDIVIVPIFKMENQILQIACIRQTINILTFSQL